MAVGNVRDILINLLGKETVSTAAGKAADGMDDLGDSMKATAADAKRLDREIEQAEAALRDLAVQYARADDAAQRMDLAKAMRRQQSEIRRLTKAKDLLPEGLGDEAGKGFGARFVARVSSVIAGAPLGPAGAVAGATVAAAMAPLIGGAISAALLGGAAGGGIAGGIALAAKDSRVQDAGRQLAEAVMGDVEDSSGAFVAPVIKGIGLVRDAWGDVSDEVDDAFGSASEYVVPLARGIAGAVREIAPGFRDAAAAARPVVREISHGIPRIGRALGDMLSGASDDADEAAASVRGIFIALEGSIRMASALTSIFSDMVGPVIMLGQLMAGYYDIIVGWIPGIGQLTDSWVSNWDEMDQAMQGAGQSGGQVGQQIFDSLRKVAEGADTATVAIKTWDQALRGYVDGSLGARAASRDLEAAIDAARESVAENGRTLDENTPKGRANAAALDAIAVEARNAYDEILAFNGSQEEADAKLSRGRQQFLLLADAMGMDAAKAKELADRLFALPPKVDVKVRALTDEATGELIGFEKRIRQLDGRVITIRTRITSAGEYIPGVGTQLRSMGGPIFGSGPRGVDSVPALLAPGEHVLTADEVDAAGGHAGVERIRALLRGERSAAVASSGAGGAASAAAGGAGGGPLVVALSLSPGWSDSRIIDAVFSGLQVKIRNMGGNVQDALGS